LWWAPTTPQLLLAAIGLERAGRPDRPTPAAVDATAERFETRTGPVEDIAESAAEVRRHRDPDVEPAQLHPGRDLSPARPGNTGPCNAEATRTAPP
jgi:hypothetical protein